MPLFGITYGLVGVCCLLWGLLGPPNARALLALGPVVFLIGAFNGYVEEWNRLKVLDFSQNALGLLIVFLGAYTVLSIRLMEQIGIHKRGSAFLFSYVHMVYVLSIGLVLDLPETRRLESPALALFIWVIFMCVLHVPMFAAGKSQAMKVQEKFTAYAGSDVRASGNFLRPAVYALAAPLLITLIIQVAMRNDWRLFGSNVVMAGTIASLFAISRDKVGKVQKQ